MPFIESIQVRRSFSQSLLPLCNPFPSQRPHNNGAELFRNMSPRYRQYTHTQRHTLPGGVMFPPSLWFSVGRVTILPTGFEQFLFLYQLYDSIPDFSCAVAIYPPYAVVRYSLLISPLGVHPILDAGVMCIILPRPPYKVQSFSVSALCCCVRVQPPPSHGHTVCLSCPRVHPVLSKCIAYIV